MDTYTAAHKYQDTLDDAVITREFYQKIEINEKLTTENSTYYLLIKSTAC